MVVAPHFLRQRDRGALHRNRPGHHVEDVIHSRGPEEVDPHRAHHESKARGLRLRFRKQRVLLRAHQPQMVGTAALHEAQVVGVIDDPGKIGVLIIDADLHVMTAVADHAVEIDWCHFGPLIADEGTVCAKSSLRASMACARDNYDKAGICQPSLTSTISGGTPRRNGTMLQPSPPETITSQLTRA